MVAAALTLGAACTIAYQDARRRSFHAVALATFAVGAYCWMRPGILDVVASLLYVALVISVLYGVLCLRHGRRVDLTAQFLGEGDLLLLGALALALPVSQLNTVVLTGCGLGIAYALAVGPRLQTVPFATMLLASCGLVTIAHHLPTWS